jgi:hypothetical protein
VRRSRFLTLAAGAATLQACDRPGGPAPAESEAAALTFPAALEAIQALIARDKADPLIAEFALPRLYHHGKSTDDAVVLFHGFTNSSNWPSAFTRADATSTCRGFRSTAIAIA